MPGPTYTLLASSILTSSTASVTFSSISAAYRDLVLVASGRPTSSLEAVLLRFNGDTGSNYLYVDFSTNGTSISANFATTMTSLFFGNNPLKTNSDFVGEFQIFDYSISDKSKPVISRVTNPTEMTSINAGRWNSTSVINSITISPQSANWASGCKFFLYGIIA